MATMISLFVLFIVGASTQGAEPSIETLRARAQERMRQLLVLKQ